MPRSRRISQEQVEQAADLMEQDGVGITAAAFHVKASSVAALRWHLLEQGVVTARMRFGHPTPGISMRNGSPVRGFTPTDDAFILEKTRAGMNPNAIGKLMSPPRRRVSVYGRLLTLAARQAWEEEFGNARGDLGRGGDPSVDRHSDPHRHDDQARLAL